MEATIELDRDGLAGALAAADLTTSQIGRLAARHLLGERADPGAVHRLGDSLRVTAGNVLRATDPTTPVRRDRATALAAALQRPVDDLTAPRVWGLRAAGDDRLLAPGGVAVLHTSEGLAWRTIGCLVGAHGPVCAQAATAEPAPLFASDVDHWVAENFDDLDADEREHVIALDPAPAVLRVLDCLDVAGGSTSADERRLAVTVGLVRAFEAPELAHLGSPAEIALDTIEQAHDLAARRLSCDRLRDAGRPIYSEWGRVERNLSAAIDHARTLATLDDVN